MKYSPKQTKNYTLRVISTDISFVNSFKSYESLFTLSDKNSPPTLNEILFKNTIYIFDKPSKTKHPLIYALIKLLKKKHTKKHNLQAIFCRDVGKAKLLVIAHDTQFSNIISYHLLQSDPRPIIYVTNIMEKIEFSEPAKYEDYTKELFNKKLAQPDLNFKGNIIIINRVNHVFVEAIVKKFPLAKNIFLKIVDFINLNDNPKAKNNYLHELNIIKKIPKIKIFSYSKLDSISYSLYYEPNGVNISEFERKQISWTKRSLDIFFAGRCSGLRFKKIKNLILSLESASINYFLVLTSLTDNEKKEILSIVSSKTKISFSPLSYTDIIQFTRISKAILDLYRISPDEGYSYRIGEAIGLNCKVITDRSQLLKEKYYSCNNFLISETLSFSNDTLVHFINNAPCNYDKHIKEIFNIEKQCFYQEY